MAITGRRCPEIDQIGSSGIRTAHDGFHACLLQITYLPLTATIMRHASEVKVGTCIILLTASHLGSYPPYLQRPLRAAPACSIVHTEEGEYMKNVRPPILREPSATRKRGIGTEAIAPATLRSLGDRVRQARARRGMTRKQLARDSGVSERYLAQIESGNGNISVLVLRQLAKALSMSVDVLLLEDPEPPVELVHTVEFLRRLSSDDLKLARQMLLQQFGGGLIQQLVIGGLR